MVERIKWLFAATHLADPRVAARLSGYNDFVSVVVTVSSTEIHHLVRRSLELELMSANDPVADGLPGVPGRASKTLDRALRANFLLRDAVTRSPKIGDLLETADVELLDLPGVASGTLGQIRDGLLGALVAEERRRAKEEQVTWEVLGPKHTTPLVGGGELVDVSNPCREGRHYRCSGKIALQQLRRGKRYTRCKCPFCQHPKIRTMPLKQ